VPLGGDMTHLNERIKVTCLIHLWMGQRQHVLKNKLSRVAPCVAHTPARPPRRSSSPLDQMLKKRIIAIFCSSRPSVS